MSPEKYYVYGYTTRWTDVVFPACDGPLSKEGAEAALEKLGERGFHYINPKTGKRGCIAPVKEQSAD